jgi:Ca2+-binding RTX toxin-like protein
MTRASSIVTANRGDRQSVRSGARRARAVFLATLGLLLALAFAQPAFAESCAYDAGTRTVTASITPGGQAALVVSGGEIWFGAIPGPCGGATTTNTNSISIAGAAGSDEQLTLDNRGGTFAPGFAAESNIPEIEIATTLGDATDTVVVYGTEGDDVMAAGQNGLAGNSDGDVDVTFAPGAFRLEVHLLGGNDYFNGRGQNGAGLHFLGPITATGGGGNESLLRGSSEPDVLDGGPGNDVIQGQESADTLIGGEGNDTLNGGSENDGMIGGPGQDVFNGSGGDDTIDAKDDEADISFNGGAGFDTAVLDAIDPTTVAIEVIIRPVESCTFDPVARSLSLVMTPASTATLVVVGQELWWGQVPAPCGGATVTNTDSISIVGAPLTTETLILDQRGGFFGPGFTPETNTPEIEITTSLGNATDRVIIHGTEGNDFMAAGQNGVATSSDGDVDVTFSPNAFNLEVHLHGGDDHFDARGTGGAGLHFTGPTVITGGEGNETLLRGGSEADSIDGGPGNDLLDAQQGADVLDGGPGDDFMTAGSEDDTLTGGPGRDTFIGSDGADTFNAQDDEADASFSGGAGADTAYIDTGLDPTPIAVENVIGDGEPPPGGPGCVFDAVTRTATATMAAGEQATLLVVGGEIHFGATPAACGAATTANTDTIVVNGIAGSTETLVVDQSGGAFAPGASAEAGASEIEISTVLGDAGDVVIVHGTPAPDAISVGLAGVALNADGDADLTFSPLPARIEVFGHDGPNTINGRGGSGAGAAYTGTLALHAGDSGDALTGGSGDDELHGGAGNDTLTGFTGADTADGGGGGDTIAGNDGDDDLSGGAGADSLIGGGGADMLQADDDEADTNINGGQGSDTALYDLGIDPNPVATETLMPA